MQILKHLLLIVLAVATLASCAGSRKKNSNTGQVIILKDSKAGHTGYKKGWTKNPNNPHHPRTTNPGHTKHKAPTGGDKVIIVKNEAPASSGKVKAKPGNGGHGKGEKGKGGKGKGKN